MISSSSKSPRQTLWRLVFGLFCVAIVVLGSTMQAAHSHPGGDLSHSDCSLCLSAHSVAQVVSGPVTIPAILTITAAPSFKARSRQTRLSVFALFTRPPPADSTLA